MRIIFYVGIIGLLLCCQNRNNTSSLKEEGQDSNSLQNLYNSSKELNFVRYGICNNNLMLGNKKCAFFFMNQCIYEFNCQLVGSRIEVLWDYEVDCFIYNDLDSIVKAIKYPRAKEAIGAFSMLTDTTLVFKAYDEEKLNLLNLSFGKWCDTLFPKHWILLNGK